MSQSPKRFLFKHFARIGAALGHSARLEILDLLAQGEKAVETLARDARLTLKNTSAHLRRLREAALVTTRRDGTRVYYRLADPAVYDLLSLVQDTGRRQLAEVRELVRDYFAAPSGLENVSIDELLSKLGEDSVTLIDVRPEDEYRQGHIPGAISIPLAQLDERLDQIPRRGEVVAYCRGAYCVLAVEASVRLGRLGFRVRRLADGMPAWARRGLPVAAETTGEAA